MLDPKKAKQYADNMERAAKAAKQLQGTFGSTKSDVDDMFSGLQSITDEITGQAQGYSLAKKAVSNLSGILGKVKDATDDISQTSSKDLKTLLQKAQAEKKNLLESQRLLSSKADMGKASQKELITLENITGILGKTDGLFGQITASIGKAAKNEKMLEQSTGLLGDAAGAVDGIFRKMGGGKLADRMGMKDALKSTKDMVKGAGGGVSKFKSMTHFAKGLGKNLLKSFGWVGAILALVQKLVEAFKFLDGAGSEIAKNYGISASEGREVAKQARLQAVEFGNVLVTQKDMIKGQASLNSLLGTSVNFTADMAGETAEIAKYSGLGADAQKFYAQQMLITGKSQKELLNNISLQTMELNHQTGLNLSFKEVQEGIASSSKSTLLTMKAQGQSMANMVFQTKMLGASQQQMETVGGNLLNFQSSIEAEMKAELLTGKQLNLEKARQYALEGNIAGLAAEIRKEIGTAAEFGKMNVIQQQALAASLGMSREEMSEMLYAQEQAEALAESFKGHTDENGDAITTMSQAQAKYNQLRAEGLSAEAAAKELGDEALANHLESASIQDRMAAITEQMQSMFVAMVEPLMPAFEYIANLLGETIMPMIREMQPIFDAVGQVLTGIMRPIFAVIGEIIDAWNQVFNSISETMNEIFGGAEGTAEVFETIGEIIGWAIKRPLEFILNNVLNYILPVVESIGKMFKGVGKILNGDILEGLQMIGEGILGYMIAPFNAVINGIITGINWLIEGINFFLDPLGWGIGLIPSVDLAGMVGLAEGGIVDTPTTALIGEGGEPEAVIPLSKAGEMGFGGDPKFMAQMIGLLKKIAGKDTSISMNGSKVGKMLSLVTSRM